jgi:metallo-beta-lactamase class B
MRMRLTLLAIAATLGSIVGTHQALGQGQPDHPSVTVRGKTYTPRSILARNMGTEADQTTQFAPHKVIGNVYYVGTRTLSSFLIVTPQGNILLDSTYERNVPVIQKSVADLGFKFSDVKILLGNHAHGDHQEGDALVKQLTGAEVIAMAEDVPALQAMKPGGKDHPIDRIIHDGDTVTLGDTTLVAHLTAGHTAGCTTWTMVAQDGGKAYNVVFHCSLRAQSTLTPEIVDRFNRTFTVVRALPCDVPLGDHPAQYDMLEKYPRVSKGGANPFIDAANCNLETDIQEAMFRAALAEQRQTASLAAADARGQVAAPATLAEVTMSAAATRRAHLQEINVETAMKLVIACITYSKAANPAGGASVVVVAPSGNIVVAMRTDGQTPNNFDSAYQKAKTALYMRQPTRAVVNRWGSPEPALARAPLNMYLVEGGYPIIVEDMMIGAIGVGGASGGDEQCGHTALTEVLGTQPPIEPPARPATAAATTAPPQAGVR